MFYKVKMLEIEGVGDEVVVCGGISVILMYCLYKTLRYMALNTAEDGDRTNTQVPLDQNGQTRTNNQDCSICLSETRYAVKTNCGHSYCGSCFFEVWRRTSQLTATQCPYCRQKITLLLTYFSPEERNAADPADIVSRNGILTNIHLYNQRYSGEPRSWIQVLQDAPTLLAHLWSSFFSGEDQFTIMFQLRIFVLVLFYVLYLLSPLDLIPEIAFGIVGILDDIVLFLFLALYLSETVREVMSRLGRNNEE
jgi:RING finger protein 170